MKTEILDPQFQTTIFIVLFFIVLVLTVRSKIKTAFLDLQLTDELKGFAIFTVVFGHIGLFLTSSDKFLFPLSILSGVGVNLFLLLSGFGLTMSQIRNPLNPFRFYIKRLVKLFIPLWIILTLVISLDLIFFNRIYPSQTLIYNFSGFFPSADLTWDIDSPLWYFTLILFYYLIFPLVLIKRAPIISAIIILLVSQNVLRSSLITNIHQDVLKLHYLHIYSFPLGIILANIITNSYLKSSKRYLVNLIDKYFIFKYLKLIFCLILLFPIGYFAIHSGVGESIRVEQNISVLLTLIILLVFLLKPIRFKLFEIFGIYSYEIYLLHWPLVSRYDLIYKYTPAWLATLLYLGVFLSLGFLLQKFVKKISSLVSV